MTDDIPIDPSASPTAAQVATDQIDGRHHQIVKLALGEEGRATPVTEEGMSIALDPGQTLPVGGRTKAGHLLPQQADEFGGQILSDAPRMITGQAMAAGTLSSILFTVDTQGYQSISVQLKGTWAATVTFYISNDGSDWSVAGGWAAASANSVSNSAFGNGMFIFPCVGKFFKAQVTSYTSGTVLAVAWLRNQPVPYLASTPNINIAQLNGNNMLTGGAQGVLPVGGYPAVGFMPSTYPVYIGGWDGALTRRILTDPNGAVQVVGQPTESNRPVTVKPEQSSNAQDGMAEALTQIVRELRAMRLVLQQLPTYLNSGSHMVDEDRITEDPRLFS